MSPQTALNGATLANLRGILAASGLTEEAQRKIANAIDYGASLELSIRENDHARNEYSGDNSYDARKMREYHRDNVKKTQVRFRHRLAKLGEYADTRGAMLTDALNGLADLGKTDEQLACEAIAAGLAPFLKQHKCARCGWREVPYGSHATMCDECAHVTGEWLNSMGLGMLPHVARCVAARLSPTAAAESFTLDDDDGVPGCGCGGPECSQCGTPQADDVLEYNRCATAGAVTVTDDERDAFTL